MSNTPSLFLTHSQHHIFKVRRVTPLRSFLRTASTYLSLTAGDWKLSIELNTYKLCTSEQQFFLLYTTHVTPGTPGEWSSSFCTQLMSPLEHQVSGSSSFCTQPMSPLEHQVSGSSSFCTQPMSPLEHQVSGSSSFCAQPMSPLEHQVSGSSSFCMYSTHVTLKTPIEWQLFLLYTTHVTPGTPGEWQLFLLYVLNPCHP